MKCINCGEKIENGEEFCSDECIHKYNNETRCSECNDWFNSSELKNDICDECETNLKLNS